MKPWNRLTDLSEEELRLQVMIPLLQRMEGVEKITDVHGRNEQGLDIIFFIRNAIDVACYGLQLKQGRIGGGGTKGKGTVKEIIDQLELARDLKHPVAVEGAGRFAIDRFIVATSGPISETARNEIVNRMLGVPVTFWDGGSILTQIRKYFPDLLSGIAASRVDYLRAVVATYDQLDALDQISDVSRRTLSEIFEEPELRRRFDPGVSNVSKGDGVLGTIGALELLNLSRNSVLIGEQNDGKTAIMRMLAVERSRRALAGTSPTVSVPILVRAKDVVREGSVLQSLAAALSALQGANCCADLETDLAAGTYFVGIDGFSELPAGDDRETADLLIREFASAFSNCVVIVAARPVDFLQPKFLVDFVHYSIGHFDERQTKALITKWTSELKGVEDIAHRMVHRVREALQLPGSPIPAIIGVLVYSEQQKFITNTADAVDRYMVIRLGRYAREMGVRQEVDWTRKQDLLAEVAFELVGEGLEDLPASEFITRFDAILARLGENALGEVAFRELVESGVLVETQGNYGFHRTPFRDFFAGQHVFRQVPDLEQFFEDHLFNRDWGTVLVFAAGLRRHNSRLLQRLVQVVHAAKENDLSSDKTEYLYGSYLLGRLLANSEGTEVSPRFEVLRTSLAASALSMEQFSEILQAQIGNIGEIAALMAVDQTFFVTVGVPWLENQLAALTTDPALSEEERFLCASACAQLGTGGSWGIITELAKQAKSTRVVLVLLHLVKFIRKERHLAPSERVAAQDVETRLYRKLAGREKEVKRLLEVRSRVLELEMKRMNRLANREDR